MGHNAIKLELIEWLTKLKNNNTLDFLKIVKESHKDNQDWWLDLTNEQKKGIERDTPKAIAWIDRSFLSANMMNAYKEVLEKRYQQLEIKK